MAGLGLGLRSAMCPTEQPLHPQSCLGRQQLLAAVRQMQQLLKGQETRFAEGLRLMRSRLSALHAALSKAAMEPLAGESRSGQGPRRAPLQASTRDAEGRSTGGGLGISTDGATRHGWAGKAGETCSCRGSHLWPPPCLIPSPQLRLCPVLPCKPQLADASLARSTWWSTRCTSPATLASSCWAPARGRARPTAAGAGRSRAAQVLLWCPRQGLDGVTAAGSVSWGKIGTRQAGW